MGGAGIGMRRSPQMLDFERSVYSSHYLGKQLRKPGFSNYIRILNIVRCCVRGKAKDFVLIKTRALKWIIANEDGGRRFWQRHESTAVESSIALVFERS